MNPVCFGNVLPSNIRILRYVMQQVRLVLVLTFFVAGLGISRAQDHSLQQYTAVDGLPQSQVNAMVEDQFGYLWIGTSGGGLARFDGREFIVYTTFDGLLSNIVTSLFIDSRGVIWIVHPRGITRFDGTNFRKYQTPVSTEGMKRIRRLVEFRDTLFIVSNGLVGRIHRDSVYSWAGSILPGKTIFFTHVTAFNTPCYYLNDTSFLVPSGNGYRRIPHGHAFNTAYNMYNHGKEVWIETDKGTFALNLTTGEFSPRRKMIQRYIIGYDSATAAYWTRDERTLFRERVVGDRLETDTLLRDVPISQVLLDKEGNAWLGSGGNGLYRYYAKDFDNIFHAIRRVMAVAKDADGNTWVGGQRLVRLNNTKTEFYPLPNGDDDGVRAIAIGPKGGVWVGSFSGLGMYDRRNDKFTWYNREHGLMSAYITSLEFDDRNRLWIGTTGGGLNRYDGTGFYHVASQGLKNVASLKYLPAFASLYIGTEVGLYVVSGEEDIREIPIPQFENTTILSMAAYRDTLLLAGSGGAGVAIIDPKRSTQTFIGPREGLPSGFVFFVNVDENGRIWIGTEKGITRIRLNDRLEITETRDFGANNGLTGIETNPNANFLSPEEKYFGLIDGLYRYSGSDRAGMRSYPVHLTNVEILYGEASLDLYGNSGRGFFHIPASLALPFDKNHITFQFNRVDKRYPKAVRYRYELESFDKTWSQPSATGKVTYSNLPPGNYVFRVMATNSIGAWEKPAIAFPFSVEAPFYRTMTFYGVTGGLLVGSLILFVLVRMRRNVSKAIEREHIRQQEQEALRKEIARDFHDEMGNQLTRIINYVSLMRLGGDNHGKGQDLYRKVEESAKYLYNGTRDFIWAIDPVNDELAKLFLHIRDFGQKLFEEKDIHFRAFNEIQEKVKLPYGFSREANLIFKEAMTNAFKHAGAKNVSFWIKPLKDSYEMVLEDDGAGIEPEQIATSNGIRNIQSRAEKIKAVLSVDNRPNGPGTRVQLLFSITKKNTYDTAIQKTRTRR